jgi:hypothetical protein
MLREKSLRLAISTFVCTLALVPVALGQTRGSVSLEPMKQLRKDVDAWPLIAHAFTPAEQRVNAFLNGLNERMMESLKDCDAGLRETKIGQRLNGEDHPAQGWERTITVTMTGPRFLSMVTSGSFFCGGPHPYEDRVAIVFDLTTGKPVNWMTFIARSANASAHSDKSLDGTAVEVLIVPALYAMTLAKADKNCQDAYENPQPYQLWPDAKSGTLTAEPFGLPLVLAGCVNDLALTPDQARRLGFDDTLLNAITQANRQFVAMRR